MLLKVALRQIVKAFLAGRIAKLYIVRFVVNVNLHFKGVVVANRGYLRPRSLVFTIDEAAQEGCLPNSLVPYHTNSDYFVSEVRL